MALSVKQGNFGINNSTGNQIISGVGFTPKIVIFTTSRTLVDDTVEDGADIVFGAMTATEEFSCVQASGDNAGTSKTWKRFQSSAIVGLATSNGVINYKADFVSMNADGFTIDVAIAPSSVEIVGYIALGGDDCKNVYIGENSTGTSTGSKTLSGAGFTPNSMIVWGMGAALDQTNKTSLGSIGFVTGPSDEGVSATQDDDNEATTKADRRRANDSFMLAMDSNGAISGKSDFTAFNSDGCAYNISNAYGDSRKFLFIFMDILNVKYGTFNSQSGTGQFSVTGAGFKPDAVLFASTYVANGTSTGDQVLSIGMTDGANQWNGVTVSENGQGTSDTFKASVDGSILSRYNPSSKAKTAEIDLVSLDSDGFTLDQTNGDGDGTLPNMYIAFGGSQDAVNDNNLDGNLKGDLIGGFQ